MQRCFVTVGSTVFDPLIHACLAAETQQALATLGYTHLRIQAGNSANTWSPAGSHVSGLTLELVDYLPDLAAEVSAADMVIAHCGAGTVLECLRLPQKPLLIVVANETLMDNHQVELRDALVKNHYCLAATPSTLLAVLNSLSNKQRPTFAPLPKSDGKQLNRIVSEELDKLISL